METISVDSVTLTESEKSDDKSIMNKKLTNEIENKYLILNCCCDINLCECLTYCCCFLLLE